MGTFWGGLAGAVGKAQSEADELARRKKAEADAKQTNNLQRAALLAGLTSQGISQSMGPNSVALGDTGFYQDPSQTPAAVQKVLLATKRAQRIGLLKSKPELAGVADDQLAAIADDDMLFNEYLKPKVPGKKAVAFDAKTGKPVVYDADNPEFPADFVGPHAERPPVAQQHVVDPVTGEVKFFDPTNPPKGLKVNPVPRDPPPMTSVGVDEQGHPVFVNPRNPQQSTTSTAKVVSPKQNAPPTDAERIAAGFADRMAAAHQTLTAIEAAPGAVDMLTGTWGSPSGSGDLPLVGNWTLSNEAQVYKQAQQNWVRANLRKESGAAIGKDEMATEIATYFPQPGDSKSVVSAKQRAREIAEANMRRNAGNAMVPPASSSGNKTTSTGGGGAFADLIPRQP